MTILLAILAVTFAAFSVWLTVRIVNRRERWAKRTAISLAILAAYPLSAGPLQWAASRGMLPQFVLDALLVFYSPIRWLYESGNESIRAVLDRFIRFWS